MLTGACSHLFYLAFPCCQTSSSKGKNAIPGTNQGWQKPPSSEQQECSLQPSSQLRGLGIFGNSAPRGFLCSITRKREGGLVDTWVCEPVAMVELDKHDAGLPCFSRTSKASSWLGFEKT